MSLLPYRQRIDAIDDQILKLLEERAEVAHTIGSVKKEQGQTTFHDPEREENVLSRLAGKGAGLFPSTAIRAVFREVISACLSLEQPLTVAFLGPEGTFSHMAARHLFGLAARYSEATNFDGVFDAVRVGGASYGVVPIENSTEGAVTATVDALIDGDLLVRQELVLEIGQCLLGRMKGLTSIERVYSYKQPLAQCRLWLAKHLPHVQLVETDSTTAAAKRALEDDRGAAIASKLAAELYGLDVLREHIQDRAENATRFFVVGKADAPPTGDDKTTLAFSVHPQAGSLRRVLGVFEDAGINMTKLESRPSRLTRADGTPARNWDYVFVVDIEGHRTEDRVAEALEELRGQCDMVKVLGSYARRPAAH